MKAITAATMSTHGTVGMDWILSISVRVRTVAAAGGVDAGVTALPDLLRNPRSLAPLGSTGGPG